MNSTPPFTPHVPGQPQLAHASCMRKQELLLHRFENCKDAEALYERIIELGKELAPFPETRKSEETRVSGCQSTTYVYAESKDGLLQAWACSDALISQGLAALLLAVYADEPLEAMLCCPPTFLETLGIASGLTPSRANGLYSMHLHLKKQALHLLSFKGEEKGR